MKDIKRLKDVLVDNENISLFLLKKFQELDPRWCRNSLMMCYVVKDFVD